MAVLIVAFLSIIVYLKVQHRKGALPQGDQASSGSISKSTQSTLQQPSFDLKQSITEIKSCVFNQVSVFFQLLDSRLTYKLQWKYKKLKYPNSENEINFKKIIFSMTAHDFGRQHKRLPYFLNNFFSHVFFKL